MASDARPGRRPLALLAVLLAIFFLSFIFVTRATDAAHHHARAPTRQELTAQFFSAFRTTEEVVAYMQGLASEKSFNCSISLVQIGVTYEGRAIRVMRIQGKGLSGSLPAGETRRSGGGGTTRRERGALILGGVHGREWITVASTLWAMTRIIEMYGDPRYPELTHSLDHITLHFVPLANPDGYHFTWNGAGSAVNDARFRMGTHTGTIGSRPAPKTRLWRGNRKRLGGGEFGVDLNRNWGSDGISWGSGVRLTSSQNYQGPSGFSEPETSSIRNYALKRDDVTVFIDVHCCLRSVRAPFALEPYSDADALEYAKAGFAMVTAMQNVFGNRHRYEFRSRERGRFSSGISTGWTFSEMGIDPSYTIELGGRFIEPASHIVTTGQELLAALLVGINEAATRRASPRPRLLGPGAIGPEVLKWQSFLAEKGFHRGRPGSAFGPNCVKSTTLWQKHHNLTASSPGKLDAVALSLAMQEGFQPHRRVLPPPTGAVPRIADTPLPAAIVQGFFAHKKDSASYNARPIAPAQPAAHSKHRHDASERDDELEGEDEAEEDGDRELELELAALNETIATNATEERTALTLQEQRAFRLFVSQDLELQRELDAAARLATASIHHEEEEDAEEAAGLRPVQAGGAGSKVARPPSAYPKPRIIPQSSITTTLDVPGSLEPPSNYYALLRLRAAGLVAFVVFGLVALSRRMPTLRAGKHSVRARSLAVGVFVAFVFLSVLTSIL